MKKRLLAETAKKFLGAHIEKEGERWCWKVEVEEKRERLALFSKLKLKEYQEFYRIVLFAVHCCFVGEIMVVP